ncbi:putative serine/threonine-protein kinase fhkC [Gracilariopsis chorda]|uniref:Putative serine/threonine-protein kinase fhkC n=1 Tax=Gracilariopsis chorda TaxID=448386 RepID=A0A2V3ITD5_9FLOR|nr:putative serine/threonine-protein kinase fhkC [Gracilariopsis chorda]|eukprot:PXF45386.1 putative serine/threonine-protein kinase fhkC [Gracilariopsis chorda]
MDSSSFSYDRRFSGTTAEGYNSDRPTHDDRFSSYHESLPYSSSSFSPPTSNSALPKSKVAVLSGPIRSFCGWALVRLGKLSRSSRRWVLLHSCVLSISHTQITRHTSAAQLTINLDAASATLVPMRFECQLRTKTHRVILQFASEPDMRCFKAAFEYANRSIDRFYKLLPHKQLGTGRASKVVFAFDTCSGDHAAVKVINKQNARLTDREFAEKEVIMRMSIQHPSIVQTLDIFESPLDLFVVMELMPGGSLDRRMARFDAPLSEPDACIVMQRLFTALAFLHSRGIVHRNVKPENIFLDLSNEFQWPHTAKLSDFSLACFLDDPDSGMQVVGTPEFLAPEASIMSFNSDGHRQVVFGMEIDMWAAGVTLYSLLSMELPFEGEYPPDVFKKARSGELNFPRKSFRRVSTQAISLIRALLNVDRRKRLTAQTVLLHPWFEMHLGHGQELIESHVSTTKSNDVYHSELISKWRSVACALMFCSRLVRCTPGTVVREREREREREEMRFEFNVSSVSIAPERSQLPSVHSEQRTSGALSPDKSKTVLSRLSSASTVKTGSSSGTGTLSASSTRNEARTEVQKFDTSPTAPLFLGERHDPVSFEFRSVIGMHRLMKDTADIADRERADGGPGSWFWIGRKR